MTKLHLLQNSFVLVSHNEDDNVTEEYLPIAEHAKVVKWFAQNVMLEHPKIEFIPIGIANRMWTHGDPDVLLACIPGPEAPKTKTTFFNFSVHTNPGQRQYCLDTLSRKGLAWTPHALQATYLQSLASHRFAISPPGNGIDCHRIWESLYVGTVPIVLRSVFTQKIQEHFPCVILNSWEEFSEDALPSIPNFYCLDKLKFSYFADRIASAVAEI